MGKRIQPKRGHLSTASDKKEDRMKKREFRKLKAREAAGSWRKEAEKFSEQLKTVGLRVREVPGDGNCLFRALGDQLFGDINRHDEIRVEVVRFLRDHKDDYLPFIEDDEDFDDYCNDMNKSGTWGGNLELQCFSLRYQANVTIYQINYPRWEVKNFEESVRALHISYHDGDHYNSLRAIEDLSDNGLPLPVNLTTREVPKSGALKTKASENSCETAFVPTNDEKTVMYSTQQRDLYLIRSTLRDFEGDVNACVEYFLALEYSQVDQEQQQQNEEQQEPSTLTSTNSLSSTSTSPTTSTTSSSSSSSCDTVTDSNSQDSSSSSVTITSSSSPSGCSPCSCTCPDCSALKDHSTSSSSSSSSSQYRGQATGKVPSNKAETNKVLSNKERKKQLKQEKEEKTYQRKQNKLDRRRAAVAQNTNANDLDEEAQLALAIWQSLQL